MSKRILILSDSLALPREKGELQVLEHDKTWPELLRKRFPEFTIAQSSIGSATTEDIHYQCQYWTIFKPDLVFIQVGLCDCLPRAMHAWEVELAKKLWFGKSLHNFVTKNVQRLRDLRSITLASREEFAERASAIRKLFKNSYWLSITFSDGTMNREVTEIKSCYRSPEFALKLYKTEGVDVERPGYSEACYIDLGNRALAYFPQWRGGWPDADFAFARMCYGWALNSTAESGESEKVKEWARANLDAVRVLSGVEEPGYCPVLEKLQKAELTTNSDSVNKKEVALIWPELGIEDNFDLRDSALGKRSAIREETAGGLPFRMSYVEPSCYWSRLMGLSENALFGLRSSIEANQWVMIWGACDRGSLMSKVLSYHGLKIAGFIDNDPEKIGKPFDNLPVTGFDFKKARDSNLKVVLAVSEQQSQFILDQLDECGMREILLRL